MKHSRSIAAAEAKREKIRNTLLQVLEKMEKLKEKLKEDEKVKVSFCPSLVSFLFFLGT
jgi:hypothetical protein